MKPSVEIVRCRSDMKDFLRLPYGIYRNNPHWVPPLESEVRRVLDTGLNPYFRNATLDLFLCRVGGTPVARASLVVNLQHEKIHGRRSGFFGFFEAQNNVEAVRALFNALECEARLSGVEELEGPFNPHHYSELGLLEGSYDEDQAFFQTYNPSYYHDLLADVGFEQEKVLVTARSDQTQSLRHTLGTGGRGNPGEYRVREFDDKRFEHDLEVVRSVFNDAFSNNWNFLPASPAEHHFAARSLMLITDPSLVTIVEHRGHPAGVLLCVRDVNPLLRQFAGRRNPWKVLRFLRNRRKPRTLIVYAVGIVKAFQRTRVHALLYDRLVEMAKGYDALETTWMSPENRLALASARRLGMSPNKKFVIYRKDVSAVTPEHVTSVDALPLREAI
jgi:hypothetical protein